MFNYHVFIAIGIAILLFLTLLCISCIRLSSRMSRFEESEEYQEMMRKALENPKEKKKIFYFNPGLKEIYRNGTYTDENGLNHPVEKVFEFTDENGKTKYFIEFRH